MEEKKYLTITALTKYIKYILEDDAHLSRIYLRGEISNLTKHSRGHYYFSLKDENSQIRAIMFSSQTLKLKFSPKEGDKVLVLGSINVYEPSGSYSLQVYEMEVDGIGDLHLAYEKLKKEFEEKGYFKEEHKNPIPKYPKAIGVITSPTGAAIRDIIHTIERRYPLTKLILYPTLVQGEGAKKDIVDNISRANEDQLVEVLIVGRGGGSIEDLWAFNEREVVEAIYSSKIPIISAIGHETDFTLADFVSDLRAPTPTAGAELATPDVAVLKKTIITYHDQIKNYLNSVIKLKQTALVYLDERLSLRHPLKTIQESKKYYNKLNSDLTKIFSWKLENKRNQLSHINYAFSKIEPAKILNDKKTKLVIKEDFLNRYFSNIINQNKQKLSLIINSLETLNPLKLMSQGYSISLLNGQRLTSVKEVSNDDVIETYIKDGKLFSVVIKKEDLS